MKTSLPYDRLLAAIPKLVPLRRLAINAMVISGFSLLVSCQKEFFITEEKIRSFQLLHADGSMFNSLQLSTRITGDSVCITVSPDADVSKVYCKIDYVGMYITPEQNKPQDFSTSQYYYIAGKDGAVKTYVVVVTKAP